nr:putative integron gene cassette protein [uncultured bacterium]
MGRVIWSPSSTDDANSIAEFIAKDSPHTAALFVERLFEKTDRLAEFPQSGRIIKEIGRETTREIIFGNYRIMYLIEDDDVWITAVVHGARDWTP